MDTDRRTVIRQAREAARENAPDATWRQAIALEQIADSLLDIQALFAELVAHQKNQSVRTL